MTLLAGLLLAAVASLAVNASYLLQHAGLASAPEVRASQPVRSIAGLLRSPGWRRGAALGYAGLAVECVALALAPLSLVQAIIAAGLVVVAVGTGRSDRVPVALVVVGAVALCVGQNAGHVAAPGLPPLLVFLAAIAVLGAALTRRRARGLAAGLLYGGTTVAIAYLASLAATGTLLGARMVVALVAAAAVTAGGFFLFQRALQDGRPARVVTLMTAGTNAGAIAGAVLVFAEPLGSTPALAALHVAGLIALTAAAALAAGRATGRAAA
jgi:hypothetical protein